MIDWQVTERVHVLPGNPPSRSGVDPDPARGAEFMRVATMAVLLVVPALAAEAQYAPRLEWDTLGDAVIRRTDAGGVAALDESQHAAPDLWGYQIGLWEPVDPAVDLYSGAWSESGGFLRVDVGFFGLVHPPGPVLASQGDYDPWRYGPNPVFGFIEFDVDDDVWTGGETGFPQIRYLVNVSRFGGFLGAPRFFDRIVTYGEQSNNDFATPPLVQRSGEEFHLVLRGDEQILIRDVVGNGDGRFDWDETWIAGGRFLHRAHGYEQFSLADGPPPGAYLPEVDLLYTSYSSLNLTIITMVYPLTNAASARHRGQGIVQLHDGNADNQNSIAEALDDLIFSVEAYPPDDPIRLRPEFPLIAGWEGRTASAYLTPNAWYITLLLGMAYLDPPPAAQFAWTDVHPEPLPADVDGDGVAGLSDRAAILGFIAVFDGDAAIDGGPPQDGCVELLGFAENFSLYDLNYDGRVDGLDAGLIPIDPRPGDIDGDFDVDGDDRAIFVAALADPSSLSLPIPYDTIVQRADFNDDGILDGDDVQGFVAALFAGP
jgi:hypothetical protein